MNLPVGRDKQIRDKNLELRDRESNPIRNYLTTESVARLSLIPLLSDRISKNVLGYPTCMDVDYPTFLFLAIAI